MLLGIVVLLLSTIVAENLNPKNLRHEYCIIGAGPAGLQLAYFLGKVNRDYIVIEKNNNSGSFFNQYPRHRQLISLNKRNTGELNNEFNLRHDWNSLLTNNQSPDDTLKFTEYSNDNFPPADTLVKYLEDFKKKFNLNVLYNTKIENIECQTENKPCTGYKMNDQNSNKYECKVLIIATGLSTPNVPETVRESSEGYEVFSTNSSDYEGKTVLILGRGNAAFETATAIYGVTNLVHMVSRSRIRNAYQTHYVGDVRAVNNQLLDTYQLKSLDGFLDLDVNEVSLVKISGKYYLSESNLNQTEPRINSRVGYDKVLRCLGFKFDKSIFKNVSLADSNRKYPRISADYESIDHENMFFTGTIAHSLDFRRSSGGFIHGFRYNVRALFRILQKRFHQVEWPSKKLGLEHLLNYSLKRFNEASGPYQMFGYLVDIISLDKATMSFEYFEEFPLLLLSKFTEVTGKPINSFFAVNYQYNSEYSGADKDVLRLNRVTSDPNLAHESNFLHPVVYYFKKLPKLGPLDTVSEMLGQADENLHLLEDFLTLWTDVRNHQEYLRRFYESVLNLDFKTYSKNECMALRSSKNNYPIRCRIYFNINF